MKVFSDNMGMDMNDTLRTKIEKLPTCPGCYIMKEQGKVIYVGKAINLKNRVSQYFRNSKDHTVKVRAMVARIEDFDIVLCDTNLEALILECNLIKKYRPQYNILLKDDKHYPYLRINVKEPYPRVEIVRRIGKDGAKYFGPYMGTTGVREVMDTLRSIFPLRTCSMDLSRETRRRPCLHYQVGECLAPCAGLTDEATYRASVEEVIDFLNGRTEGVMKRLQEEMTTAAKQLRFEQAAAVRDRIRAAEQLMEKQKAINVKGGERDILAVATDEIDAMVEILFIRGGQLIGAENVTLEGAGDQSASEIFSQFLMQYYDEGRIPPAEILCVEMPDGAEDLARALSERRGSSVNLHEPHRGEKHQLVEMAKKNAVDALEKRNASLNRQRERTLGACEELQQVLGLSRLPRRIEGYDISNTQGLLSVASMVVAMDGEAVTREYRKFRIKTVEGANDFASMNEVLTRRLTRAKEEREKLEAEGKPLVNDELTGFAHLPDLVLIDGGPQQLRFAREAMRAVGYDIPIFGLAKRLEEIWLPDSEESILLDRKSPALHLIQRVRDEAHRFCITYHRELRQKEGLRSSLESIPGIGPQKRRQLLRTFGSVKKISELDVETLKTCPGIGAGHAETIYAYYHPEKENVR